MTGKRITYFLHLAASVIFHIAYQEWFSEIILLGVFFLPLFSLLVSLPAIHFVRFMPDIPKYVKRGAYAEINAEMYYKNILPPCRVKFKLVRPNTGEKMILNPPASLPTEHCGGLTVEFYRAKIFDFCGLFAFKIPRREVYRVYVLPEPLPFDIPLKLRRTIDSGRRAKHGGGYAENHEIRPYREGDAMNLVHWKMSAKTGQMMIREPMIPDGKRIIIGLSLTGTAEEMDRKIGRLLWLAEWLLEQSVPHEIRAMTGDGLWSWTVQTKNELDGCMEELLFASFSSREADEAETALWHCKIGGEAK